jgi:branched-chain amino acid transport system ATP-binding protein
LAPLMVEEVMRIMKRLNEESGLTILMVEQNANVALRYCDYAYVLNVGEIVMHGSSEVMQHDPEVQKIYLGA